MADLYGTLPSSNTADAHEPQEISSFLHHFIHNSSSSSSSPMNFPMPETTTAARLGRLAAGFESDCRVDSFSVFNYSDPGCYFPAEVKEGTENMFSSAGVLDSDANTSSKRRGVSGENDLGDFSCDSEGPEASEVPLNPALPRSSSKRSRAAEVHNLSEKRRRSRINEKMKALQNLIPNSNKTDKASMLDEAIEYLKQLQLQVQMLSLRNGLSLHPMCLPGVLQHMQLPPTGLSFDEGNNLLHTNGGSGALPMNQETLMQTAFNISNQRDTTKQPIASMTKNTNLETLSGFEQSIQAHYGTFNPSSSSKEICGEDTLLQMQSNMNCSEKNLTSGVS